MKKHITIRIAGLRFLSGAVIALERATQHFWRAGLCALFFAAIWLFQIPNIFGVVGQSVAFLGFIGGVSYFFWRDARGLTLPSKIEIDRRIESDSAVKDRPLSSKGDNLANPYKRGTRNLWSLARSRLHAAIPLLKPAQIKHFMAARDPYALRMVILMAFGLGLIAAGGEWKPRIINGLTPFSYSGNDAEKPDAYTLWITPPDYTALPSLVLNEKTIRDETLTILQGSTLKAIVNGGWGLPSLYFGEDKTAFDSAADGNYSLEILIPDDAVSLTLKQTYLTKASWPVEIILDTPPAIALNGDAPEVLDNGQIRFPLSVFDDYGVETLTMTMHLDEIVDDAPLGNPAVEERSILSPPAQNFGITPVYDLTAHYWAGLPAVFTFTVRDKAGQVSQLAPITMALPERKFEHPVAKTLMALRKKLAWQPLDRATYATTEHDLNILLTEPDIFQNDILVYMAIRSAEARLNYNPPSLTTSREVMSLMWDTALRVEDGDLSLTARKLREAQLALEEALKDSDVTDEELAARMDELRSAMAEYLQELGREFQKRSAEGLTPPPLSPEALAQFLNPEALADFLDQMESQMRDGDPKSAQEMLAQLQRLLDTLNPSMNAQLPPDMQMMQDGVNELEELIEGQEKLLEQTEKQAGVLKALRGLGFGYSDSLPKNDEILKNWGIGELPPSPEQKDKPTLPFVDTASNQAEQEALRYILGQLMLDANEALDEIPESMGFAEREMRGSSKQLAQSKPDTSAPHQEQAIEFLKQAQEELAQQLQQRMQQMTGFALSFGMPQRFDPLGRPISPNDDPNGQNHRSHVEIPDEAERRHVQEILKILRRRAGQQNRPQAERDYYRRLLKRF